MKKWKTAVIMMAICVILCCGCGKNESLLVVDKPEKTEIVFSWWGDADRHEYTIKAIKNFEELYPNINVILKYGDWTGYKDRIKIEMAAHAQADVMQINYAWLEEYSPDGDGFFDIYERRPDINLVAFDDEF